MHGFWMIQQVTYHMLCPILVDFSYIFSHMFYDQSQIFLCVASVVVLCGSLESPQKQLVSNIMDTHTHTFPCPCGWSTFTDYESELCSTLLKNVLPCGFLFARPLAAIPPVPSAPSLCHPWSRCPFSPPCQSPHTHTCRLGSLIRTHLDDGGRRSWAVTGIVCEIPIIITSCNCQCTVPMPAGRWDITAISISHTIPFTAQDPCCVIWTSSDNDTALRWWSLIAVIQYWKYSSSSFDLSNSRLQCV